MIDIKAKMFAAPFADVRSGFIARARLEAGRTADARTWMVDNGFELLDVPDDRIMTDDGREVLRAHGKSWALTPREHARRLEEGFERAKQRDAAIAAQRSAQHAGQQPDAPTVCTALIAGQLCGGALARAAVCPRSALGKMGVTATLTCDVCDAQTAVMR